MNPQPLLSRRGWLVTGALALAAFVGLALQVVLHGHLSAQVDPAISLWLAAHRSPALTVALLVVTQLHSTVGIDLMLFMGAVTLLLRWHRLHDAIWLVLVVEGAMLLNVVLKHAFVRLRPDSEAALVHLATFSFPSGHALASTVLWTCAVCLVRDERGRRRAAWLAACVVMLVCFSRVYLGAHYLSDVLAGAAEGLLCIAVGVLFFPRTGNSGKQVRQPA